MSEYDPLYGDLNANPLIASNPFTYTIRVEESIPTPSSIIVNSINEFNSIDVDPSAGDSPDKENINPPKVALLLVVYSTLFISSFSFCPLSLPDIS